MDAQHGSSTSSLEPPPLLQLPGPLLQAVLQLLEPRDMLSAARSCSQLRASAAGLLDRIEAGTFLISDRDSVLLYLERHGRHVSSLTCLDAAALTRLPASCSRLQALDLDGGRVQLGASDSQPGVLQTASALTSLCIDGSDLADTLQGAAAAVARLTQLQRLGVLCARFAGRGVLHGSMLAPLQALTALDLRRANGQDWLRGATLGHLSSLSGLQDLSLWCGQGGNPTLGRALTAVQHLQQLTVLRLEGIRAPILAGLSSSLQRLELRSCGDLDPQVLAGCSQLRHLHLHSSPLAGGPEGTAALLEHLQQCTQLTHLQLRVPFPAYAPPASYAALTASSSLEVLGLSDTVLPRSAWQPMFGGSQRLPRLQTLRLNVGYADGIQAADLTALVQCCPALQSLSVTGLHGLSAPDLLPLTALTRLTCLYAWPAPYMHTPGGQPPDVASRLRERVEQQAALGE